MEGAVLLDPGDLGFSWGRDLASYDLRSNSLRTFSSAASGTPPLEKNRNPSTPWFLTGVLILLAECAVAIREVIELVV